MNPLATLPRLSWPERASHALAWSLTALGGLGVVGGLFGVTLFTQPLPDTMPVSGWVALSLLIFGVALLAREWQRPRVFLLAGLPGLFGLGHLLRLWLGSGTAETAAVVAGSLILGSLGLLVHHLRLPVRFCLPAKAAVGSLIAAIGVSTLLGYLGSLPAVYMWGSVTPVSPVTAGGLILLGLAVLVLTWRDTSKIEDGAPRWSPVPAVIAALTITCILWVGLRERERVYQNARTQTAMETLAIQIGSELERQANTIERLTRKWSNDIPTRPV